MPYVMIHSPSGTLLSYVQRNGYQLAYYGLRLWEDEPSEAEQSASLAEAGVSPDDAAGRLSDWQPLKLNEHETKMANVKLRNDPSRVAAYREGAITVTAGM